MSYNDDILYFKVSTGARTRSEIKALIAQIDALIDALLTNALTSVNNGNVVEYELDTGQTKTKVKYSDTNQVLNAVKKYEALRTYYENKLTSRKARLIHNKNLNRRSQ